MLDLYRHHDFQVFISPKNNEASSVNPPRFTWPQAEYAATYTFYLEHLSLGQQWKLDDVCSPVRIPQLLPVGNYRWKIVDNDGNESKWLGFSINQDAIAYLPPTAEALFERCVEHDQFLMYFDEDIQLSRVESWSAFEQFKRTAEKFDLNAISYPNHYIRGQEEGKRTAIANVREWIDRDLIALVLLYKIWNDETSGDNAVKLLLRLAEWSPEGPASLLRPCTWGDEVGLSLARNLFLAYHWLSPLLTDSEKEFVRPMLIRIAYQMEERLEQDQFKQFPGHSHTSRLPAYLGIAALALHKEYSRTTCARWLDYALMIYQSVLPFYGGEDGSWAEGPFYSSSYSKWFHPFFLSVERIQGFSFYNHPFYREYCKFAMDFVAPNDSIHPFGDGFWCKRDGKEWPGFFAQNPLRIYADRFGNGVVRRKCHEMESNISTYDLHLLDVIPTKHQINYANAHALNTVNARSNTELSHHFYAFAGLGKVTSQELSLSFRSSPFGNSSHRHADQGNIALLDNGHGVLIPTGSYGYRFGSGHHTNWTRTTQAHNLPLIDGCGQILDNESADARLLYEYAGEDWYINQLDLTNAYEGASGVTRHIIFIAGQGVILIDNITLTQSAPVQWRLHSELGCAWGEQQITVAHPSHNYALTLASHPTLKPTISYGYDEQNQHCDSVVSDANPNVTHIEWSLPSASKHFIAATCSKSDIDVKFVDDQQLVVKTPTQQWMFNLQTGVMTQ
ncbi:heparinase II/III family protein [Vibrio renipiscarius]|uniref:heparinase II/III domain-containing protein n=1 Tax=Vibrio renipiscarius TaxID=1461322 RepID=UPI00354DACD6